MAEEEEKGEEKAAEGGKKGLLNDWKEMKGWQKAGVLIGGGALVVAILMYINSQNNGSGAVASAPLTSPGMEASNYPGYGDVYPSVPTQSGQGSGTQPPVTSGSVSHPHIPSGDMHFNTGNRLPQPSGSGSGSKKKKSSGSVTQIRPGVNQYTLRFTPGTNPFSSQRPQKGKPPFPNPASLIPPLRNRVQ